jgi:hypothetical protein
LTAARETFRPSACAVRHRAPSSPAITVVAQGDWMKTQISKRLLWSIPVIALLAISSRSDAGYQDPGYLDCWNDPTYGGFCRGTFYAWRNGYGTSDWAAFDYDWNRNFQASLNNQSYSCYVPYSTPADSDLAIKWNLVMNSRGYFYIGWDKSGNCTELDLENASSLANF